MSDKVGVEIVAVEHEVLRVFEFRGGFGSEIGDELFEGLQKRRMAID